jgi:hypothetical protein
MRSSLEGVARTASFPSPELKVTMCPRRGIASPAHSAERPATSADGAHAIDELSEVTCQRGGFAWVLVGGHDAYR